MPAPYFIKDGYRTNPCPVYFLDDPKGDIVFQPDVLVHAEELAEDLGVSKIFDVGCGWAEKLANLHSRRPEWRYTGIDFGANIEYCRSAYPWGTWVEQDLENPTPMDFSNSVVVASDVIEHLSNPDVILDWISSGHPLAMVLSTPDRNLIYGETHLGPPPNLCHIREWSTGELLEYLSSRGWWVTECKLTRADDRDNKLVNTLIVAI